MTRATRAVIDLAALRHNLRISQDAAPNAKQMAIIKAHAYGHGMVYVAQALEQQADAFGVALIEEAIPLREAGISKPILLLEGLTDRKDLPLIRGFHLQTVVHHEGQVAMLEEAHGEPVSVWLKIDTGMHRLGFAPEKAAAIYQRLLECDSVAKPIYLMTHLANADDRDDPYTAQQLKTFYEAIAFNDPQSADVICSIANSAGVLGWPDSHADWVRPGIMLYGVSPFVDSTGAEHDLQAVMSLQSELIAVNHFKKGDTVGYGGSWTCPEAMPVGVVAIGYGDGYPRHARPGTPVLVNGQRSQLIGRVSMDMVTVDLRNQPHAKVGDPVVLWGKGLAVEEVADYAGTIAYELLCSVTNRVLFEYLD